MRQEAKSKNNHFIAAVYDTNKQTLICSFVLTAHHKFQSTVGAQPEINTITNVSTYYCNNK